MSKEGPGPLGRAFCEYFGCGLVLMAIVIAVLALSQPPHTPTEHWWSKDGQQRVFYGKGSEPR